MTSRHCSTVPAAVSSMRLLRANRSPLDPGASNVARKPFKSYFDTSPPTAAPAAAPTAPNTRPFADAVKSLTTPSSPAAKPATKPPVNPTRVPQSTGRRVHQLPLSAVGDCADMTFAFIPSSLRHHVGARSEYSSAARSSREGPSAPPCDDIVSRALFAGNSEVHSSWAMRTYIKQAAVTVMTRQSFGIYSIRSIPSLRSNRSMLARSHLPSKSATSALRRDSRRELAMKTFVVPAFNALAAFLEA